MALVIASFTTGWRNAQRYWKTLLPSKRGPTSDYLFNFLQDFEAILDHELYSPLREVIHLLSADPEERLPGKFSNTHQPGLFASEEFDAVSLLLSQKLLQGDRVAVGIAKVPVRLAIDFWFSCRGHSKSPSAQSTALFSTGSHESRNFRADYGLEHSLDSSVGS
jgi:hypothetical protein